MAAIVGTKEAKELSIVRHGANQHSHVLITKNLSPAPKPVPASKSGLLENDQMDFETMKALAAMNEITKAHFIGLDEAAAKAFIAKSAEERDAEAQKAFGAKPDHERKAIAHASMAAAHFMAGKAAEDANDGGIDDSLENSDGTKKAARKAAGELESVKAENSALKARLDAKDRDEEIQKTARSGEFDGYPGGSDAVADALKTYDALPQAARESAIALLKSHAALAKSVGNTEFGARDEAGLADLAKRAPASAEVEKGVLAIMEAEGCTKSAAMQKFSTAPVNKKLMGRAMQEQGVL